MEGVGEGWRVIRLWCKFDFKWKREGRKVYGSMLDYCVVCKVW